MWLACHLLGSWVFWWYVCYLAPVVALVIVFEVLRARFMRGRSKGV